MAEYKGSPVCGLCRKIFDSRLDDDFDEWHDGPFHDDRFDLEYEYLCPECYAVVVDGEPEERKHLLDADHVRAVHGEIPQ